MQAEIQGVEVSCPYCGEVFSTQIDTSVEQQVYTEDCYVCCQPIVFSVTLEVTGLLDIQTRTEDEC